MIIVVRKVWKPASCVTALPRASCPPAVRNAPIFEDATIPIAMGNVIPANPGAKGNEKNAGSLMIINSREASTQR